jgi:hypothetical protein
VRLAVGYWRRLQREASELPRGFLDGVAADDPSGLVHSIEEAGAEFDEPVGERSLFVESGVVIDDPHGQRHDVGIAAQTSRVADAPTGVAANPATGVVGKGAAGAAAGTDERAVGAAQLDSMSAEQWG